EPNEKITFKCYNIHCDKRFVSCFGIGDILLFPISHKDLQNYTIKYLMEVIMTAARYRRIVLKLSGEDLSGKQGYGIEPSVIQSVATQVKEVPELDVEVAVVVGVRNICCLIIGSVNGLVRSSAG